MKGVIFTTFEAFVTDSHGEDALEDIIDAAELETTEPFVAPGTYPATDMVALLGAASQATGDSVEDLLRAFGRFAFPLLANSVPQLMDGLDDAKSFFLGLEAVIHTEIRKLDATADPARFHAEDHGDTLTLRYESDLGLFPLVEGFIDGVGAWYDEAIIHEVVDVEGTCATFALTFAPAHTSPASATAGA